MATLADIVRKFYSALAVRDTDKAASLMTADAEWITMEAWRNLEEDELKLLSDFVTAAVTERYAAGWVFKMNGRGPQEIVDFVLDPLLKHGSGFEPSPSEFRTENDKIVWLGNYNYVHSTTGERDNTSYAHVYTIKKGKIARLYQFFYTLSTPEGSVQ